MIPVITLDGPTASGKGTVSYEIALRLGWNLLDSGILYRIVAWAALEKNIPLENETLLAELAMQTMIGFYPTDRLNTRVYLENQEVTDFVRTPLVSQTASKIAQYNAVREALLAKQRAFRRPPGLVADGRDMGTQVFKDASLKIFLTASVEERARRRRNQLKDKGLDVMLRDLICDLQHRDGRDMNRAVAPLTPAEDAVVVDTTNCSIEEVVESILRKWACVVNLHKPQ